ncbi:MAG: hypothetical protein IH945_12595, partial [Armatimonadetes bacterium]|nr:hypothetical protein [Armatimonadota bacterium]
MEAYDPLNAPDPDEWQSVDEQERIILVMEHHREAGVKLPNERLHATVHVIVENQIALGDEIPARATLERLIREGLDRHDCAVCLYDSVNYLMSIEQVSEMFDNVHGILHRGGLFIFDVCTETNSIRHFRDMRERERGDGFSYTRHSYYKEGVQFNEFKLTFDEPKREIQELHQQRIYPLREIDEVIAASSFNLEAAYDG